MYNKERLVKTFVDLCRCNSESLNERETADYIIRELSELDVPYEEEKIQELIGGNTGNLIFKVKGKKEGEILLSSHIDTVCPGCNVNPVETDDLIKSDGTTVLGADDKAGVAIILETIKTIKEKELETPSILGVFTIGEEIGLVGSRNLKEEIKSDFGIVLDSNGKPGTIINQAPYHETFKAKIIGKSAHAGVEPEKGINAIKVLSEIVTMIEMGRIDEETTFNIGKIQGGVAGNIVPEEVDIEGEVRSFDRKKAEEYFEKVKEIFESKSKELGGKVIMDSTKEYDTFHLFEESNAVLKSVEACKNIGLPYNVTKTGGGSDANIFNQRGVDTVVLGLGYENIHSKSEYIEKENLYKTCELTLEILKNN